MDGRRGGAKQGGVQEGQEFKASLSPETKMGGGRGAGRKKAKGYFHNLEALKPDCVSLRPLMLHWGWGVGALVFCFLYLHFLFFQ